MTETEEIIQYLQSLPLGTVIKFADDHMDRNRPWCASWVDVRLDDAAMAALRMNWVWTIENPNNPELATRDLEAWELVVEHDLDVHSVWDEDRSWYVNQLAVPKGSQLPHVAKEMYKSFKPNYIRHGGWSPKQISDALADWSAVHAGRADLRFEWAPDEIGPSNLVLEADATLQAIQSGETESYEITPQVRVTSEFMDTLLAMDPDESAALTAELSKIIPGTS